MLLAALQLTLRVTDASIFSESVSALFQMTQRYSAPSSSLPGLMVRTDVVVTSLPPPGFRTLCSFCSEPERYQLQGSRVF